MKAVPGTCRILPRHYSGTVVVLVVVLVAVQKDWYFAVQMFRRMLLAVRTQRVAVAVENQFVAGSLSVEHRTLAAVVGSQVAETAFAAAE